MSDYNELVNIDVNVTEQQTGEFQVGLSVGSLSGATFITSLNEKNIMKSNSNEKNLEQIIFIYKDNSFKVYKNWIIFDTYANNEQLKKFDKFLIKHLFNSTTSIFW